MNTIEQKTMNDIARLYTTLCMFNCFTSGFLDLEHRKLTGAVQAAGWYRQQTKQAVKSLEKSCQAFLRKSTAHRMSMDAFRDKCGYWLKSFQAEYSREMMDTLAANAYDNVRGEWTMFQATCSNFIHARMKDTEEAKTVTLHALLINGLANITLTANKIFVQECERQLRRSGFPVNNEELTLMKNIIRQTDTITRPHFEKMPESPSEFAHCQATLKALSAALFDKNEKACNLTVVAYEMRYVLYYVLNSIEIYRQGEKLPRPLLDELTSLMGSHTLLLLKEWKNMSRWQWDPDADIVDKEENLTVRLAAGDQTVRWTKELINQIKEKKCR